MVNAWLITALLAVAPFSELRGAIPFGIASGLNPWSVWLFATGLNVAMVPVILAVLHLLFEDFILKIPRVGPFVERVMVRANQKAGKYVDNYGVIGLALFVGVPLPVTGAYTGCLVAYFLKMDRMKAIASIAAGVLIASVIVTLVSVGALNLFTRFIG